MYNGLVHAHSGLRWLLLLFLVAAVLIGLIKWRSGKPFIKRDRTFALLAMIFTHLQFVIGLVLYFISPKVSFAEGFMENRITRFYTVEHFTLMILAVILITIGYSRAKRADDDTAKHRLTFIFFGIGLVLILLGIPWPGRGYGAGWG